MVRHKEVRMVLIALGLWFGIVFLGFTLLRELREIKRGR